MAIAIGSAPSYIVWRSVFTDYYGKSLTKSTDLDGTTDDTTILELANDIDLLSSARITNWNFNHRVITGQKSSASNTIFPSVFDCAELAFSKVNPVDSSKTVVKSFLIPAIVQSGVVDTDLSLIVGTAGTGSLSDRLARVIDNLEEFLTMKGSDGVWYPGGWTFVPSASKKIDLPGY